MNDAPSRLDIVNCYRLALGRDPESEAVVEDKLSQSKSGLLPDFFSSAEFDEGVRNDVPRGSPPQPSLRLPPSAEIKTWAAGFAPLSPEGVKAVEIAESWAGLYRALFADESFIAQVLNDTARARNPAFVSALAAREELEAVSRIEGRIELITPHEIRGWALDRGNPQRRLGLELWIEGVFRAAVTCDRYRLELQERFGGSGVFGFALTRPPAPQGAGPLRAELREARSGAVIDVLQLPAVGAPPMDAASALRRELAEVRTLLARIEARLPDVNEAYSFATELYGDYFDTYYAPAQSVVSHGAPLLELAAIVDAASSAPPKLDGVLANLAGQGRAPYRVVVIHPGGDLALEFEHVLSIWRGRFQDAQSPYGVVADHGWATAMQAATEAAGAPHLLLLQAGTRLAPDASEQVHEAFVNGAALVYADSDAVDLRPDGKVGRHWAPALRTAFDAELFLQQGDIGPLVGLSLRLVQAIGFKSETEAAGLYDFVLRGLGHPELGGLLHIPRVLAHLTAAVSSDDLMARHAALEHHLATRHPGAEASPHADHLGATVANAFRVRHPLPAGARAAIIIPTRDRLDLLEPCLTSLAAMAEHNQSRFEFLIVDNQSREPETFAFLERFGQTYPLRVISHDGAFNWALINNRAAAQTDAEVLIFLNNDTVALTPDWCDELCSQALRPGVGAVGARLIYADGTIQHAGMVAGGWHAFVAHEGVGAQGSDPGYLGRHALLREVSTVTGACMATSRSVFENLGGFDALNLPVEGNDTDYCFRLRAAGLKILYDPYCTLYHYESKSRGSNIGSDKLKQAEAAGALLQSRWGESYHHDPFYNPHFDRLSPPCTRLAPPPSLPVLRGS